MGDLSNLRHLDISGTDQLKEMPVGIGELIHLQTLPKIVLGGVYKLGLKELRLLKQLRDNLAIFDLQILQILMMQRRQIFGARMNLQICNFHGEVVLLIRKL